MAEYKTYLDPQSECFGCNGIRCGSCLDYDCHDTDKHPSYENDYVKGMLKRKKQTNADRIRAMSDDELAEFLRRYFSCEYECPARLDYCYESCQEKVLEWLKKEVSND